MGQKPLDVDELLDWLEQRYADYASRRHEPSYLNLDTRAAELSAVIDHIKKMAGKKNA